MQAVQAAWSGIKAQKLTVLAAASTQINLMGHLLATKIAMRGKNDAEAATIKNKIYRNPISKRLPDVLSIAVMATLLGRRHWGAGIAASILLGSVSIYAAHTKSKAAKKIYIFIIPGLFASCGILGHQAAQTMRQFGDIAAWSAGITTGALSVGIIGLTIQMQNVS